MVNLSKQGSNLTMFNHMVVSLTMCSTMVNVSSDWRHDVCASADLPEQGDQGGGTRPLGAALVC
jgi:hypothetical protein